MKVNITNSEARLMSLLKTIAAFQQYRPQLIEDYRSVPKQYELVFLSDVLDSNPSLRDTYKLACKETKLPLLTIDAEALASRDLIEYRMKTRPEDKNKQAGGVSVNQNGLLLLAELEKSWWQRANEKQPWTAVQVAVAIVSLFFAPLCGAVGGYLYAKIHDVENKPKVEVHPPTQPSPMKFEIPVYGPPRVP